jgi:Holliday junction DNA helicase RuvA
LTRAPGVGARLAARLLTELKDKVGAMPSSPGVGIPLPVARPVGTAGDALSALVNLGYRRPEAQTTVARVVERLGDNAALDAIIRDSLKELAGRAGL